MKMKSFAVLAMSGILAASVAYAVPEADDASNIGQAAQQAMPSDNSPMVQADNSSSSQSNDNNGSANAADQGSANAADQGSPDTATGDDDY